MDRVAIVLVAAGGLLELGGVVTVAREIRRNLRVARGLLEDEVAPTEATWESYTAGSRPHRVGRRTLATRYEVDQVWQALYDEVGELEQRMDERDHELESEVESDMVQRDNELRSALREALAPDRGWPYVGVAALGLGIALTTAGAVLGALA